MEHMVSEHSAAGHWEGVEFAALEATVVPDVEFKEEDSLSVSEPSDDSSTTADIETVVADGTRSYNK